MPPNFVIFSLCVGILAFLGSELKTEGSRAPKPDCSGCVRHRGVSDTLQPSEEDLHGFTTHAVRLSALLQSLRSSASRKVSDTSRAKRPDFWIVIPMVDKSLDEEVSRNKRGGYFSVGRLH